jgi:hypothetical protein
VKSANKFLFQEQVFFSVGHSSSLEPQWIAPLAPPAKALKWPYVAQKYTITVEAAFGYRDAS